jgi:RNA polymerase sigma-70 factor (ECF subfamily)
MHSNSNTLREADCTQLNWLRQLAILTDSELTTLVLAGSESAFAELYSRYQKLVAHIVRRYFQHGDEVEEMVQLIFIEVWVGLSNFRGENVKSFPAWVGRVATNSCYDTLRRRQRSKECTLSQLSEDEAMTLHERRPAVSTGNQIEQATVSHDLLQKLLLGLEPCDRQVFVMLKAEDHSIAEIAAVTGWSEAKIKMRIRRSRSILQRRSRKLI